MTIRNLAEHLFALVVQCLIWAALMVTLGAAVRVTVRLFLVGWNGAA